MEYWYYTDYEGKKIGYEDMTGQYKTFFFIYQTKRICICVFAPFVLRGGPTNHSNNIHTFFFEIWVGQATQYISNPLYRERGFSNIHTLFSNNSWIIFFLGLNRTTNYSIDRIFTEYFVNFLHFLSFFPHARIILES